MEVARWRSRPLEDLEVVYLWVDGIDVKAGLEKDKAALLVVLAALSDGRKVVLAVTAGHRESTASWAGVLRDLRDRGLRAPRLIVGDRVSSCSRKPQIAAGKVHQRIAFCQ